MAIQPSVDWWIDRLSGTSNSLEILELIAKSWFILVVTKKKTKSRKAMSAIDPVFIPCTCFILAKLMPSDKRISWVHKTLDAFYIRMKFRQ